MTRLAYIELILRAVYAEQPSDDSAITINLVNTWIPFAIGMAAKQNWKESVQLDGVAYANNSFYISFSGITIPASPDTFTYQITLPQIPFALGKNEGVASLRFVDSNNNVSYDGMPLSTNQLGYRKNLKQVPNKIIYWSEGIFIFAESVLPLNTFTAMVRMASGGNSSDLNSILNVPDEYFGVMTDYLTMRLKQERFTPKDVTNDGQDN